MILHRAFRGAQRAFPGAHRELPGAIKKHCEQNMFLSSTDVVKADHAQIALPARIHAVGRDWPEEFVYTQKMRTVNAVKKLIATQTNEESVQWLDASQRVRKAFKKAIKTYLHEYGTYKHRLEIEHSTLIVMALSSLFLCYKTHKDPTHKAGCIKPYVFMKKISIIAKNNIFHRENDLPRTSVFDRDGWDSG